jgi:hypothetical protein
MKKPAVMIYRAVAARAVTILTEIIQTREGTGIGIGKETGIVIVIEKDTGNGRGVETETDQGIENGVLIMIGGQDMQREKAEGTITRVAVMVVDIPVGVGVGAAVEAGVEVGAYKLPLLLT